MLTFDADAISRLGRYTSVAGMKTDRLGWLAQGFFDLLPRGTLRSSLTHTWAC
jgi:hypothetical protein